jgi:hypothetical protein
MKLSESVTSVRVELPAANMNIKDFNQTVSTYFKMNETNLDFYIKAKFSNFEKMIQVDEKLVKD